MVWNIKYGTLQSWQTLDKIMEKQSAVVSRVQSHGACCACCIPGFICVGFRHCVAVCQFLIDTCSLASALGQLDSTAKWVLNIDILKKCVPPFSPQTHTHPAPQKYHFNVIGYFVLEIIIHFWDSPPPPTLKFPMTIHGVAMDSIWNYTIWFDVNMQQRSGSVSF